MPSLLAVAGVVLSLVADDARAARSVKRSGNARNTTLYTIGAPRLSKDGDLQYPSGDGCFAGIRFVNVEKQRGMWKADDVPELNRLGFQHPKMQFVELDQDNAQHVTACGQEPYTNEPTYDGLHDRDDYVRRISASGGYLREMAMVGLANSYELDKTVVSTNVQREGWTLAGSWVVDDKVSRLMKKDDKCILSFEAPDTREDWTGYDWRGDFNAEPVSFCGLSQKVHRGFSDALMSMVYDYGWQSFIRSNLNTCSEVSVVGHSLGGAMATLFSACVAKSGSSEFNLMHF